jgi:hypothetical protein
MKSVIGAILALLFLASPSFATSTKSKSEVPLEKHQCSDEEIKLGDQECLPKHVSAGGSGGWLWHYWEAWCEHNGCTIELH